MNSPISFIIPVYNADGTLPEAIDSIIIGNLKDEDEIIIVDDASTDNSPEVIKKYCERYSFIHCIKHNINKGSAAAGRNTGIAIAKNELIFCLDADNILKPGSVTMLKQYLLDNKLGAAAFGEIHYFENKIENITNKWILDEEISFLGNINRYDHSPCGSGNYLFTKESWKCAGRYNESVGGAWDSWAFGCSQLAMGVKMKTLKGTYYFHRQGYESTYIRENKKMNSTLNVTRILFPFFHLLHPSDVDYILNPYYRYSWLKYIKKRPLKGKTNGKDANRKVLSGFKRQLFRILANI